LKDEVAQNFLEEFVFGAGKSRAARHCKAYWKSAYLDVKEGRTLRRPSALLSLEQDSLVLGNINVVEVDGRMIARKSNLELFVDRVATCGDWATVHVFREGKKIYSFVLFSHGIDDEEDLCIGSEGLLYVQNLHSL
jgi:hypothetical protein